MPFVLVFDRAAKHTAVLYDMDTLEIWLSKIAANAHCKVMSSLIFIRIDHFSENI
jgi:hypothetical protein|tara:strand:+ start:604238 stop:604402 length:165 start_codon:yes stop_codon:yes gene_type:complete